MYNNNSLTLHATEDEDVNDAAEDAGGGVDADDKRMDVAMGDLSYHI